MPRDSAAADRPASYLVGTAAAFPLFFRDRAKPINQLPFSPSAEAQRGVQGEGGVGGRQGRPDRRRAGWGVRGPPEPDPQLEEATVGRCGKRLPGWWFGGGSQQ